MASGAGHVDLLLSAGLDTRLLDQQLTAVEQRIRTLSRSLQQTGAGAARAGGGGGQAAARRSQVEHQEHMARLMGRLNVELNAAVSREERLRVLRRGHAKLAKEEYDWQRASGRSRQQAVLAAGRYADSAREAGRHLQRLVTENQRLEQWGRRAARQQEQVAARRERHEQRLLQIRRDEVVLTDAALERLQRLEAKRQAHLRTAKAAYQQSLDEGSTPGQARAAAQPHALAARWTADDIRHLREQEQQAARAQREQAKLAEAPVKHQQRMNQLLGQMHTEVAAATTQEKRLSAERVGQLRLAREEYKYQLASGKSRADAAAAAAQYTAQSRAAATAQERVREATRQTAKSQREQAREQQRLAEAPLKHAQAMARLQTQMRAEMDAANTFEQQLAARRRGNLRLAKEEVRYQLAGGQGRQQALAAAQQYTTAARDAAHQLARQQEHQQQIARAVQQATRQTRLQAEARLKLAREELALRQRLQTQLQITADPMRQALLRQQTARTSLARRQAYASRWLPGQAGEALVAPAARELAEANRAIERFRTTQADALRIARSRLTTEQTVADILRRQPNALGAVRAGYVRVADAANRGFGQMSRHLFRTDESLGRIVGKVSLWLSATTAVFAVIRGIQSAFALITQMETQRAALAKVYRGRDGLGADQAARFLSRRAGDLAGAFGQSIPDVMTQMEGFLRLGRDVDETIQLTTTSLKYQTAAHLEAADANRLLVAQMQQWGLSVADVAVQVDALNELENTTAARSEDIAEGVARAGQAARAVKFDLAELNAIVAILVETTGRAGSEIGRGLRTIFSRMYMPEAIQAFREIAGIDVKSVNGDLKDGMTILEELRAAWHNLTEEEQQNLARIVAGAERRTEFLAILSRFPDVLRAVGNQYRSAGSAALEQARALDTIEGKWGKLLGTLQELIADPDAQGGLVENIKDLLDDLIRFVEQAESLDLGKLRTIATTVSVILAAFKGGSMGMAFGPVGAGISAVLAGAAPLWASWTLFRDNLGATEELLERHAEKFNVLTREYLEYQQMLGGQQAVNRAWEHAITLLTGVADATATAEEREAALQEARSLIADQMKPLLELEKQRGVEGTESITALISEEKVLKGSFTDTFDYLRSKQGFISSFYDGWTQKVEQLATAQLRQRIADETAEGSAQYRRNLALAARYEKLLGVLDNKAFMAAAGVLGTAVTAVGGPLGLAAALGAGGGVYALRAGAQADLASMRAQNEAWGERNAVLQEKRRLLEQGRFAEALGLPGEQMSAWERFTTDTADAAQPPATSEPSWKRAPSLPGLGALEALTDPELGSAVVLQVPKELPAELADAFARVLNQAIGAQFQRDWGEALQQSELIAQRSDGSIPAFFEAWKQLQAFGKQAAEAREAMEQALAAEQRATQLQDAGRYLAGLPPIQPVDTDAPAYTASRLQATRDWEELVERYTAGRETLLRIWEDIRVEDPATFQAMRQYFQAMSVLEALDDPAKMPSSVRLEGPASTYEFEVAPQAIVEEAAEQVTRLWDMAADLRRQTTEATRALAGLGTSDEELAAAEQTARDIERRIEAYRALEEAVLPPQPTPEAARELAQAVGRLTDGTAVLGEAYRYLNTVRRVLPYRREAQQYRALQELLASRGRYDIASNAEARQAARAAGFDPDDLAAVMDTQIGGMLERYGEVFAGAFGDIPLEPLQRIQGLLYGQHGTAGRETLGQIQNTLTLFEALLTLLVAAEQAGDQAQFEQLIHEAEKMAGTLYEVPERLIAAPLELVGDVLDSLERGDDTTAGKIRARHAALQWLALVEQMIDPSDAKSLERLADLEMQYQRELAELRVTFEREQSEKRLEAIEEGHDAVRGKLEHDQAMQQALHAQEGVAKAYQDWLLAQALYAAERTRIQQRRTELLSQRASEARDEALAQSARDEVAAQREWELADAAWRRTVAGTRAPIEAAQRVGEGGISAATPQGFAELYRRMTEAGDDAALLGLSDPQRRIAEIKRNVAELYDAAMDEIPKLLMDRELAALAGGEAFDREGTEALLREGVEALAAALRDHLVEPVIRGQIEAVENSLRGRESRLRGLQGDIGRIGMSGFQASVSRILEGRDEELAESERRANEQLAIEGLTETQRIELQSRFAQERLQIEREAGLEITRLYAERSQAVKETLQEAFADIIGDVTSFGDVFRRLANQMLRGAIERGIAGYGPANRLFGGAANTMTRAEGGMPVALGVGGAAVAAGGAYMASRAGTGAAVTKNHPLPVAIHDVRQGVAMPVAAPQAAGIAVGGGSSYNGIGGSNTLGQLFALGGIGMNAAQGGQGPGMGALSGALQGFVGSGFNPLGALFGGVAGLFGGLFGGNKPRQPRVVDPVSLPTRADVLFASPLLGPRSAWLGGRAGGLGGAPGGLDQSINIDNVTIEVQGVSDPAVAYENGREIMRGMTDQARDWQAERRRGSNRPVV